MAPWRGPVAGGGTWQRLPERVAHTGGTPRCRELPLSTPVSAAGEKQQEHLKPEDVKGFGGREGIAGSPFVSHPQAVRHTGRGKLKGRVKGKPC